MHPTVQQVTQRIAERSAQSRSRYLARMQSLKSQAPVRKTLSCGNLAHGFAACGQADKGVLKMMNQANVGIVTAYNDMLSAHQPYRDYPDKIKAAARAMGCTAQVAGGTPAMCDGVTQGQPGMDLSLFSRDVIAMSTAIALSHQMFDAVMLLGICDKIVPGLLMGALSYGYLPAILVPAGPMPSGLPNKEKVRIRQLYAEGKVGQEALLEAESQSYHSPGTCTFYGTANSNQLLVEVMGLHLPGAAFVPPGTALRDALTAAATEQVIRLSAPMGGTASLAEMVNEKSIVNALVALMATGGSTNHTMHWVAIARAAGLIINWDDFADLSAVVPSLTRIYPNGQADI
ncbi:MAG: phosphogluconate dehydratase, partial [Gammaproteobacteria bacterium]